MKIKVLLLASLSAMALAGCQNGVVDTHKNSDQHQDKTTNKDNNSDKKQSVDLKTDVPNNKDQNGTDGTNTDGNKAADNQEKAQKFKAEDVISSYFSAISLGDVNKLKQIYPEATEENDQLAQLFKSSKIQSDVISMKKITEDNNVAEYDVQVKLYTKAKDDNFTNNQSDYKIKIDLNKGTFVNKAIVSTKYLE